MFMQVARGFKSTRLGENFVPFYCLHQDLNGHSIVVASSNNGAVENVTLELPGLNAVPTRVSKSCDYFKEIAASVTQKDAWGLLAAPLGKKSNRSDFLRRFWWNKSDEADLGITPGLREHLKAIQSGASLPVDQWEAAVERFRSAKRREFDERRKLEKISKRPSVIARLSTQVANAGADLAIVKAQLGALESSLFEIVARMTEMNGVRDDAKRRKQDIESLQQQLNASRPGLLLWISTLGRAQRQWWSRVQDVAHAWEAVRQELAAHDKAYQALRASKASKQANAADTQIQLNSHSLKIDRDTAKLQAEREQLAADMKNLGSSWPDLDSTDEQREKTTPWATNEWLSAREEVFLAALNVHRAFIEGHPTQMLANLNLASDWLSGKAMTSELAGLALESLCLVVPVISTTFASVPRMMAKIDSEKIGWLLADESGQPQAQHAVGAIWRAKRTIIVGDPRQLEPVYAIPAALEESLASIHNIPCSWWPSFGSVQTVADQSARIGTLIPDAAGEAVWVGCPLRLHRRCDEPMFSISNRVAYGGLMVNGKQDAPAVAHEIPASFWADVRGLVGEGHWIPEEGAQVRELLSELIGLHKVSPSNIAMISPFRDCGRKLQLLAREFGVPQSLVGTVHTAQGKEADIVILCLGGNPKTPGAKSWAAAKPNLINVAVSRGKSRLYVIGNRLDWAKQNHFDVAATLVPLRQTVGPEISCTQFTPSPVKTN